jgi:hypothetical protein
VNTKTVVSPVVCAPLPAALVVRSSPEQAVQEAAVTVEGLREWAAGLQPQIAAADAKAATLFGVTGTAWALSATVLASAGVSWRGLGLLSGGLGVAGLVLLGGCVVTLVRVIRPVLASTPVYGSYAGAGQLSLQDIADMSSCANRPAGVVDLAPGRVGVDVSAPTRRVAELMQITTTKYTRVRWATTLLLASMVPLTAAVITAVLAGVIAR